ncbi:hypothetical protein DY000_02057964 [Brassica cretica]|uniref:Uncharacterized protein n=1 Tax=Brassica cretica TaxID=69181 RepID=A0ABQ7AJY5_BRACR|nr:hypothetical protein DY000_02057964 [Brassica cretica]
MLDPSKPDPDPDILIFKSGYPDPGSGGDRGRGTRIWKSIVHGNAPPGGGGGSDSAGATSPSTVLRISPRASWSPSSRFFFNTLEFLAHRLPHPEGVGSEFG